MQTDLFELLLRFDTVLVPTGLHFGTKNAPKSTKKSIKNDIRIFINVLIDFWSILASFWEPFWTIWATSDAKMERR